MFKVWDASDRNGCHYEHDNLGEHGACLGARLERAQLVLPRRLVGEEALVGLAEAHLDVLLRRQAEVLAGLAVVAQDGVDAPQEKRLAQEDGEALLRRPRVADTPVRVADVRGHGAPEPREELDGVARFEQVHDEEAVQAAQVGRRGRLAVDLELQRICRLVPVAHEVAAKGRVPEGGAQDTIDGEELVEGARGDGEEEDAEVVDLALSDPTMGLGTTSTGRSAGIGRRCWQRHWQWRR